MPAWLLRLLWRLRGKRLVRLHLVDQEASLEGILLGRWSGHYVLLTGTLLEAEGRSIRIDGYMEVPSERVLFVQVLLKDGK